jgi:hypothetical protein
MHAHGGRLVHGLTPAEHGNVFVFGFDAEVHSPLRSVL